MRRLLVLVLLATVLSPHAAWAHGDEGELAVVDAVPSDTGSAVTYRVSLTYANDGDAVSGATVTAQAASATEPSQVTEPITLTPGDESGQYEGTVEFPAPGNWTITFRSTDPAAEITVTFDIGEPPPATTTPGGITTAPAPTTSTDLEPQLADDGAGSSGPPTGLIVGLVVTGQLVIGAGTALFLRRRRGEG